MREKRLSITVDECVPVDRKVRLLDQAVALISIVYPITGIPQVLKIWVEKDAGGISAVSWCLFLVFTIPLLA
ncbi:hypothetical protein ACFL3V_06860, partial [Nanoarchaeota archaeon]